MAEGFKDHFSGHAGKYSRHRPGYPEELFQWLAAQCGGHECAWDAGTGNGQAARGLAREFRTVIGTDASANQIQQAEACPGVTFRVEPAEQCSLPDAAADLVTVGQALHWFDFDIFYAETKRVLKPGGLFAAWTYLLSEVTPDIDAVVRHLYDEIVFAYWPPERRHVEAAYGDLPFPFNEMKVPRFSMQTRSGLEQYLDYLRTWSSVQRYLQDRGEDPVSLVVGELQEAWGDPSALQTVKWPLVVRAGISLPGN